MADVAAGCPSHWSWSVLDRFDRRTTACQFSPELAEEQARYIALVKGEGR
ncbi:hypothetical protein [Okeania hirsuta]|nr:hypothetical protein [Okeania hirsuta]